MIEIQTGDNVILEPCDNMGIALNGPIIGIVEKIGRKYIHIRPNCAGYSFRFRREDGKCIGEGGMAPQWILHLSQQE